ncbi:MAG: class I SAM-dependent methyltransferase [Chromatiales bacterium]|nr:class I SAM-dependent methyltransferase [Chromatiales bacterium]
MTDHFKDKAQDWDGNELVRGISLGVSAAIRDNVLLNNAMHVMDFGAGTGLITGYVADKVAKVTAVDVSQAMLDKLSAKAALKDKVNTLCRDIVEQPIGVEFDLIVSAMAMHHVADTDKLLQRFAEHLKAGGSVALADLDTEDGSFHPADAVGVHHAGFDRDEFEGLLDKHGFQDIRFVTAHTAKKEDRSYPIFLALANKA